MERKKQEWHGSRQSHGRQERRDREREREKESDVGKERFPKAIYPRAGAHLVVIRA